MYGSLPAALYARAVAQPLNEALVSGTCRISYGQIWLRVQRLAARLQEDGLQPGDRVALLDQNSIDYAVGYYAVQMAGGVTVALNAAASSREIAGWLTHSGSRWLLTDESHPALGQLQNGYPLQVTLLPIRMPELAAPEPEPLRAPPEVSPDRLAAIMYTSGTTGRPKGVSLRHRNLTANVHAVTDYLGLGSEDRVLTVLPFPFAYGNSVLHTSLVAGACLVMENSLVYPQRVLETMVKERVTGFSGVPASYGLLLSRVRLSNYDLSHLRFMTQAGGHMPPNQIQQVRAQLPQVNFYVMYGQTEATSRLTYLPPERLDDKPGSVGIPLKGVEITVRDTAGRVLPDGERGEVWARGPSIMQGYWNDPMATEAALVDGWLRTGDIGWLDDEGFLFLDGRAVDMIKTGSHRVAPQEIEDVIAEMDDVEEVAVSGVEDPLMGQLVIAWVVPRSGSQLSALAVRAHCSRNLAPYKIPKRVEFVGSLPKTGSGKIQRHELPASTT